jgi:hypothetical protein
MAYGGYGQQQQQAYDPYQNQQYAQQYAQPATAAQPQVKLAESTPV